MKVPNIFPLLSIYATAILFSLLAISGCSKSHKAVSEASGRHSENHAFAEPIEKAHKMSTWKTKGTLKTTIDLKLGQKKSLHATLFTETGGPGIRLELGKDTVAVFDGQHMWSTPSDSAVSPFQLKVWAYFLEAPYKLNDPGTNIKPTGSAEMKGQTYDTAKLTFDPGTGDSPNDWFILYRNQRTNRLRAMTYIITQGKTVEEANKHPHAISYQNVKTIEGVPIATSWKFWAWDAKKGFSDKPVGQAMLSNFSFIKTDHLFAKPKGATKMKRRK